MNGTVSGSFRVITGTIDGDPADPVTTGHIDIVIDATSYTSDSTRRDNVVLSDALETRFYQVIKFVSTRIEDLKWDNPNVIGSATIAGQSDAARHHSAKFKRAGERRSRPTAASAPTATFNSIAPITASRRRERSVCCARGRSSI